MSFIVVFGLENVVELAGGRAAIALEPRLAM